MSVFTSALRTLFVSLVLFAFSSLAMTGVCAAFSESEAELRIGEAEMAVSSAYVAVLEAERSGANVSVLLIKLTYSGSFLAEAQMCYRNGDFGSVVYYADLSVQSVGGLVEEAEQLKALSIDEFKERSFQTVVASSLVVVVIVLGRVYGWRCFKRRSFEKVLMMKPEVVKR